MRNRLVCAVLLIPILSAAVLAATAASAFAVANPCTTGNALKTASYEIGLDIGPLEQMYTPAQVKAKNPKTGEVMLSGTMSGGMGGMGMSSSAWRHLEVHICTLKGAVVMHAHPSIVVDDAKAKTMMMTVPVATMQGIGEGSIDYHYGNNVKLTAGRKITVTVKLNGETVVFHATVPKSSMAMS